MMETMIANHDRGSLLNRGESCTEAITAYIMVVMSLKHAITAVIHVLGAQLNFFSKIEISKCDICIILVR